MKWEKRSIPIEQLPALALSLKQLVAQGNEQINYLRCVFKQEGTNIPFVLMPYDFLDLDPKPVISKFFLYKMSSD